VLPHYFEVDQLVLKGSFEDSFYFIGASDWINIFGDTSYKHNMILKLTKVHVFSSFKVNIIPHGGVSPELKNLKVNYTTDNGHKGVTVSKFFLITLNVKNCYHD
jgi:hypothetical protein